jgi:high-affinity nickel-transport protein
VLVALIVGGIEAAGVFADRLELNGGVWDTIRGANHNFGTLGFIIVGVFAASWILSVAVYKLLGYDELTAA